MTFDAVRLIERKRDGLEVGEDDLVGLVEAYLRDEVADAQMSAFFMAGVLRGFTDAEATALTNAYVNSGDEIDLGALTGPTVDKHSTGGVADTTTFVVGPIVAACGMQLAKLSGRGLGHTGGTLDKLEAIPGMRVDLSARDVQDQVERIGLAVVSATADLAPADKRTYALRDVTGTVPSAGLIAASIMSKKIAGGAKHILLDVKSGDGAFLSGPQQARELAELCIRIGTARGRKVGAVLTDMNQPLGPAVGNALEVAAAIDVLRGDRVGALAEVSVALSAEVLVLTGVAPEEARARAQAALDQGQALERFRDMVQAQGGDPSVVDHPRSVLPTAPCTQDVIASNDGVVSRVACRAVGDLAVRLGAGRLRHEDPVDPAVGITLDARVGDHVVAGQRLAVVHARTPDEAHRAADDLLVAIGIGEQSSSLPTVLGVVGA